MKAINQPVTTNFTRKRKKPTQMRVKERFTDRRKKKDKQPNADILLNTKNKTQNHWMTGGSVRGGRRNTVRTAPVSGHCTSMRQRRGSTLSSPSSHSVSLLLLLVVVVVVVVVVVAVQDEG